MRRAFTLVELLIVIIIIAVLAAIAVPKFASSSERSKASSLKAQLGLVREAMERFHADTGYYPWHLGQLTFTKQQFEDEGGKVCDGQGNLDAIAATSFQGPYMALEGCLHIAATTIDGNASPDKAYVIKDPITNDEFKYTVVDGQIAVHSSSSDRDPDGVLYNTY